MQSISPAIAGRFLEHSRIYYFKNGGAEEYFIGSADLMQRNLDRRVEVVAPVETPALRAELRGILNLQLADRRGAWDMQGDGSYVQRRPQPDGEQRSAQEILIELNRKKLADEQKVMKRQRRIPKRKKS